MIERREIAGRYVLLSELASGGMATVHFGQMLGPGGFNKVVAIKRLHPHLAKDPAFSDLFLDEARLAARIRHANVVPTLDVVVEGNDVFLVMEYVVGASLANLATANRGPLPLDVAAKIMLDVLEGLHAAHTAKDERGRPLKIVHRDVSPQNVMVGTDGTSRVLDFGIAKAVGRSQTTRDGSVKGKASYMAPEQIRGEKVDARTDVYAAGVMFWELVTGCGLFPAETPMAAMMRAVEEEAPPPSQYAPNVPRELDEIILRALAKRPDTRYPTAHAFADAIEGALTAASSRAVARWVDEVAGDLIESRALALELSGGGPRTPARLGAGRTPAAAVTPPSSTMPVSPPAMTPPAPSSAPQSSRSGPHSPHTQISGATPPGYAPVPPPRGPITDQETAFDGVTSSRVPTSARARAFAIGAATSVLLAIGVLALKIAVRPTGDATITPVSATPVSVVTTAEATASTMIAPLPPAPTTATASAVEAPPPAARPAPSARRTPRRPAVSCTPPWTLDKDGVRVLKPECQ